MKKSNKYIRTNNHLNTTIVLNTIAAENTAIPEELHIDFNLGYSEAYDEYRFYAERHNAMCQECIEYNLSVDNMPYVKMWEDSMKHVMSYEEWLENAKEEFNIVEMAA